MAKYAVRVVETLARTVIVEAENFEEATQKVIDAHSKSEIILDADDFDDSYFVPSETFGEDAIDENDDRLSLFPEISNSERPGPLHIELY